MQITGAAGGMCQLWLCVNDSAVGNMMTNSRQQTQRERVVNWRKGISVSVKTVQAKDDLSMKSECSYKAEAIPAFFCEPGVFVSLMTETCEQEGKTAQKQRSNCIFCCGAAVMNHRNGWGVSGLRVLNTMVERPLAPMSSGAVREPRAQQA